MLPRLILVIVLSVATIAAAPVKRELLGNWRLTGPEDYQRGIAEYRVTLATSGKCRFEIHYSAGRTESEMGRWRIRGTLLELNLQHRRFPLQFDIRSIGRDRLSGWDGPWAVTFDRIH